MADKPTIAFVETSLTDGSFEADLAKEIMDIVGDRAEAITIDYEDLPLAGEAPEYPLPEAALAVRDKLGNADAVWVVVSEYKKEIPDSLRNLFDWLSLPSADTARTAKCGVMRLPPLTMEAAVVASWIGVIWNDWPNDTVASSTRPMFFGSCMIVPASPGMSMPVFSSRW